MNEIAVEFTRYVLQQNPHADDFAVIYDAMSRAACTRAFNNLGHAFRTSYFRSKKADFPPIITQTPCFIHRKTTF